jgi:hypothetical protein
MSWLQFWASLFHSSAWPLTTIICIALLRPAIIGLFDRTSQLVVEIGGQKASWKSLEPLAKTVASITDAAPVGTADHAAAGTETDDGWSRCLEEAAVEPVEAIVHAWRKLEGEIDRIADNVNPQLPHGWPVVTVALAGWDSWPTLEPVLAELRRLRDATATGVTTPDVTDAVRYVSVARNLATAIRRYRVGPDNPGSTQQHDGEGAR